MEYSDTDLDSVEAQLIDAERRRAWMADVVSTLRARNHHSHVAERQLATFTAMSAAMRTRRKEIEDGILARRRQGGAKAAGGNDV